MADFLITHETLVRLAFFVTILAVMAAWEIVAPRRLQDIPRRRRWPSNLAIAGINVLVLWLIFPTAAVGAALFAETHGWGLLNEIPLPHWLAILLAVILLDLAIFLQHMLFHAAPVLWRLHRVHHADLEFDVTTGLRFHPFEILVSMAIKITVIAALGPPVVAVLIFEVLLNASSMFNHGNVRIPARLDQLVRWVAVTPDMHRVHHSAVVDETNSNFGFNLSLWDRLCGTYRAAPAAGHDAMVIGIEQFRTTRDLWLDRLLVHPLIDRVGGYAINR